MGWEAVMRVRVSKGLKINNVCGNFSLRQDLILLPVVDIDKAIGVHIKLTESLDLSQGGVLLS
jgi:hypothetical protein